jgi:thioredoxin-related protein
MHLKSLLLPAFALIATAAFAAAPKITDVNEALTKAQTENKMLFMQYGREACGNCQALKAMIKGGKIHLSPSKFVYADVDCDDSATSRAFSAKFKVSGNTLPFVVIAAPDGRQLAARSGYGTAPEFEKLIKDAEKALKK